MPEDLFIWKMIHLKWAKTAFQIPRPVQINTDSLANIEWFNAFLHLLTKESDLTPKNLCTVKKASLNLILANEENVFLESAKGLCLY